jgi:hypothetical protein
MSKISKSPNRLNFQKEKYIERCESKSQAPDTEYLEMFDLIHKQHEQRFSDPTSRVNNLEYDLLTTNWILAKVRAKDSYAQNLYAALCNNSFIKMDIIPILKEEEWSCSWRYAGGIIADIRQEGDYIDWYCSGIRNVDYEDEVNSKWDVKNYVGEGRITDEIRNDLQRLGWAVAPGGDWENFN